MYQTRQPFRLAMRSFFIIPLQCRIVTAFRKVFIDNDYYCDCHDESHRAPIGVNYIMGYIGTAMGLMVGTMILDEVTNTLEPNPFAGLPDDVLEMVTVPTCVMCDDKVVNP